MKSIKKTFNRRRKKPKQEPEPEPKPEAVKADQNESDDDAMALMEHELQFPKRPQDYDLNNPSDGIRDYVVIDPLKQQSE